MVQHLNSKITKNMDRLKKWKKNMLKRCKSTKVTNHVTSCIRPKTLPRSNSFPPWCGPSLSPSGGKAERQVTPGGCFTVYVGSEKQRFVIKTKYASHPLFKMLLDDAEKQYGYSSEGPLILPCDVGMFCKVLAEMDSDDTDIIRSPGCGYGSYAMLSPSKLIKMNHF